MSRGSGTQTTEGSHRGGGWRGGGTVRFTPADGNFYVAIDGGEVWRVAPN